MQTQGRFAGSRAEAGMCSSDLLRAQCEPPVSVAESFEDCRGLRGTVSGWRTMDGPLAGWLPPPPTPPSLGQRAFWRKAECFEGLIYHDHLEQRASCISVLRRADPALHVKFSQRCVCRHLHTHVGSTFKTGRRTKTSAVSTNTHSVTGSGDSAA